MANYCKRRQNGVITKRRYRTLRAFSGCNFALSTASASSCRLAYTSKTVCHCREGFDRPFLIWKILSHSHLPATAGREVRESQNGKFRPKLTFIFVLMSHPRLGPTGSSTLHGITLANVSEFSHAPTQQYGQSRSFSVSAAPLPLYFDLGTLNL